MEGTGTLLGNLPIQSGNTSLYCEHSTEMIVLWGFMLFVCLQKLRGVLLKDLPAVLCPEPHSGGHAGVVLGVFAAVLRVCRVSRFLFGLTCAPVWTDDKTRLFSDAFLMTDFMRTGLVAPTCQRRRLDEAGDRWRRARWTVPEVPAPFGLTSIREPRWPRWPPQPTGRGESSRSWGEQWGLKHNRHCNK